MVLFAVTRVLGPSWDALRSIREQDAWEEHAAFMDGLAEDGFVVLAGPIGDWQRIFLVVDAASEAEVEAQLAADPWTTMGLLRIGAIEPWTIWLDRSAARGLVAS